MGSGRETQVWLRMGAQEGGAGQLLLVQCRAITGGLGEPALSPAKAEKAPLIGHTSTPAAGPGGKSLSCCCLLSPGMRLWTLPPWEFHPTGLHTRRPIAQDPRERCGRMISTGGALSPQGPMWAAAKSTLPGFPQVGGHQGGLLDDLPEDKQRGSTVGPPAVGALFWAFLERKT